MSKKQIITGNIQPPNKDLEILKQNFPNCFDKNGDFDFAKFKTQLSKNKINFSKESDMFHFGTFYKLNYEKRSCYL